MAKEHERQPRASGKDAATAVEDALPLDEFEEFDVFAEPVVPAEERERGEVSDEFAADTVAEEIPHPAADEIRERYEERWMAIDGVEGVAVGIDERTGKPALDVYVSRKTEEIRQQIPAEVDDYPVRLVPVHGEFTTLPA
ncbi:MAG: hypothetical protein HY332_00845 [Chloroflexi bacterium]|nr:hypothetical protein [Chloroflexota bacterium]